MGLKLQYPGKKSTATELTAEFDKCLTISGNVAGVAGD